MIRDDGGQPIRRPPREGEYESNQKATHKSNYESNYGSNYEDNQDRGQIVLLAAVALVLALVPLTLAYLQLGYAGDVASEPTVETAGTGDGAGRATGETHTAIDRSAIARIDDVAGAYTWSDRSKAVSTYRTGLNADLTTIERGAIDAGIALTITAAPAVAARWAEESCPRGENRVFGACEADRGVVVHDRAGTTTIAAIAFELRIRRSSGTRTMTIVVTPRSDR